VDSNDVVTLIRHVPSGLTMQVVGTADIDGSPENEPIGNKRMEPARAVRHRRAKRGRSLRIGKDKAHSSQLFQSHLLCQFSERGKPVSHLILCKNVSDSSGRKKRSTSYADGYVLKDFTCLISSLSEG